MTATPDIEHKIQKLAETPTPSCLSVCFIIPAHNEERYIQRCIDSIHAQCSPHSFSAELQTIVVDSGSTDGTGKIAAELGAKVIVTPPGNAGTTRNVGAKQTDADVLAFVDADCVLPPEWLAHCLAHLTTPEVVAVGAPQACASRNATWVEQVWVDTIIPKEAEAFSEQNWLPAFNFLVRKEVFKKVGGFDEELSTCEDSDLSFRLSELGTLIRDTRVPVSHLGESKSVREFFRREMWRSRGNFQSAWKRGSIRSEFPSLFLPVAYLIVFCATLITYLVAITTVLSPALTSSHLGLTATILTIVTVATPYVLAIRKGGFKLLIPRSYLLAVYLLARSIGPLIPTPRIQREKLNSTES